MTTENTNNEETVESTDNVTLTLSDLKTLQQVVEVASQRGAFKAEELSAVGQIYDKLKEFLASVEPSAEGNDTENETTDTGGKNA
mgnify:CR=1 FL=1